MDGAPERGEEPLTGVPPSATFPEDYRPLNSSRTSWAHVSSVVDPGDYGRILETLRAQEGALDLATRFDLARKAFAHTAAYDTAISAFLADQAQEAVRGCYTLQDGE